MIRLYTSATLVGPIDGTDAGNVSWYEDVSDEGDNEIVLPVVGSSRRIVLNVSDD